MILSSQTSSYVDKCIVHINILITLIITYIILLLGKKISKKIGTTGIRIIQRIMGLILRYINTIYYKWDFIIDGEPIKTVVTLAGIEPATITLKGCCSTN